MLNQLKKAIKKIPGTVWLFNRYLVYKKHTEEYQRYIAPIKRFKRTNKNGCFLILTPVHGNLGDHAIALSEIEILQIVGADYCEIPGEQLFYLESHNKLSLMNGSPVMVSGGGFLGTLWYHDERVVRNVIIANPDSSILLFPNTIYYEDNAFGEEEFEKAKSIYRTHKKLRLFTRERRSFELSKQLCGDTKLIPDMVMRLNKDNVNCDRKGALLCLRSDKERIIGESDRALIITQLEKLFKNVEEIDTVKPYMIPIKKREEEVERLISTIRKAELVVTDRLHGMIFCAITGTPCIVINSKSPKVIGSYEWLKHLPYIRVCFDAEMLSDIYADMPHGSQKYDNSELLPLYDELISDLRKTIN